MPVLNCSTSAAVANSPKTAYACFFQMPEKQLKSIIHHAMRTGAGLSKNQASTGAACMKNQLGRHDRLAYLAAMICNQLVPGLTANQLASLVPCDTQSGCDTKIENEILWMFCNYYQTKAV